MIDKDVLPDSRALVNDIFGGLSSMLVALPSAIAFGLVIYTAIGADFAGAGAMAGIIGTAAIGIVAPLIGGTRRLISAPCAPAAAVLAVFVKEMIDKGTDPALLPLLLIVVGLLAGLVQVAAGLLKGGRIIKYIPFPVVAGYLSGVGVLIFTAQFPKFLGLPKGVTFLNSFAAADQWAWQSLVVGGVTILAMLFSPRLTKTVPAAIIALFSGIAAYFAVSFVDPALKILAGNPFVIGPIGAGSTGFFENAAQRWMSVTGLSLPLLGSLVVPALTLAVLLSIDTLKTCLVLNALTRSRNDSNRELVGQGAANVISALACGMPGAGTMGATLVNVNSNGQTRFSGLFEGIFALLALLLLGGLIAWIPVASLAAILLVVAVRMVDRKIFKLLKHRSTWIDFAVILAVVVSAVSLSLIWAAAVGISVCIFLFLRDQVKRPVVRRRLSGAEAFSKKKRLPAETAILMDRGRETLVFELQGQLFFGTTDQLLMEIEPHLARARVVVLDMRRVQAVDYTAVYVLHQLETRITEGNGTLAFAAVPEGGLASGSIRRYLADLGFSADHKGVRFFDSLDAALEWAEDDLLMASTAAGIGRGKPLSLSQFPFFAGVAEKALTLLQSAVTEKSFKAGEAVFRRDQAGSEIYFIRLGSVRISLPAGSATAHHLATFGRGDFFGDMSFLDRAKRSADAVAAEETLIYVLKREDFDLLAAAHSDVAGLVFEHLARMLAERLRLSNIELEALQKA